MDFEGNLYMTSWTGRVLPVGNHEVGLWRFPHLILFTANTGQFCNTLTPDWPPNRPHSMYPCKQHFVDKDNLNRSKVWDPGVGWSSEVNSANKTLHKGLNCWTRGQPYCLSLWRQALSVHT